ncbi:hypothetical protein HMPREF1864_01190 [Peptoniphilus sp. DNF00840]|nr:hypothetical protein HMPREF1864_01190 [Peptoniphilus sp. DNF00840]
MNGILFLILGYGMELVCLLVGYFSIKKRVVGGTTCLEVVIQQPLGKLLIYKIL